MAQPEAPDAAPATTLYEHVGGEAALHRVVATWYPTVLADPLLQPLFGGGHADHVPHLTAFFSEVFGGPTRYTDEFGGFDALLAPHRGKQIREDQRRRFVDLFFASADSSRFPAELILPHFPHDYLDLSTRSAAHK